MKQIFGFLLCIFAGSAQAQVLSYYDGTPALEKHVTDVEGEQLLYPDWTVGKVKTSEGKEFSNQPLLYNLLSDKLFFLNEKGESMQFIRPVKEFVLYEAGTGRTFRSGFPAIQKFTPETYFEVLVDGKYQLLRKLVKTIIESKDYNSPVTKKTMVNEVRYLLYTNGTLTSLSKGREAIVAAAGNQAQVVNTYLSAATLNLKKEADMIKLVQYLNTLP